MTPRVRFYASQAAAAHGTTLDRVMSKSRHRVDYKARQEVYGCLRADGFSLCQIGLWMQRDHSSITHGLQRLERMPVNNFINVSQRDLIVTALKQTSARLSNIALDHGISTDTVRKLAEANGISVRGR